MSRTMTPRMNIKPTADVSAPFPAPRSHRSIRSTILLTVCLGLLASLVSLRAQTYLLDFGADGTPTSHAAAPNDPANFWNNVPNSVGTTTGATVSNLVSVLNEPSGINLVIVDRFNGANENGTTTTSLPYPENATRDSLYGNTEVWNGVTNIFPKFKLTGLHTDANYTFTFFASRIGATDVRETTYTITGSTSAVLELDAAGNRDTTVTSPSMTPDGNGAITIGLTPGANNNNANHFTYLGVLKIEEVVPQTPLVFTKEPASQSVVEFRPATFSAGVAGSPPYQVQWFANGEPIPDAVQFNYTIPVVTADMNGTRYSVTVSNLAYGVTSTNAVLTVVADRTPPLVSSVGSPDGFAIQVQFNEVMDLATTAEASNYIVSNSPNAPQINAIEVRPDGQTVLLTLVERLVGSFKVTISNVKDLAGNSIAANTQVTANAPLVGPPTILVDFGAANTATDHGASPDDPTNFWNNVDATLGATEGGELAGLITTQNEPTAMSLVILSRFGGANANGTTAAAPFPTDATRDSLYGTTEPFSGLSNIYPKFKITGLDPAKAYDLLFYASRTGVTDIRETGYTVAGSNTNTVALNAAANVTNTITASGMRPTAEGEITVSIAPTSRNNNANHFTYLGVLKLSVSAPKFLTPTVAGGQITLNWTGAGTLQRASSPAGPWTTVTPTPTAPFTESTQGAQARFYRLKQ